MVTMSSKSERGFTRGRSTYVCECCARRTRETSVVGSDYCGECLDLAGLQNSVWDGCYADANGDKAAANRERDGLFAKIVKLGGNGDKVKAAFADLFAE